MKCEEFQDIILDFVYEGHLLQNQEVLKGHLSNCSDCATQLRQLQQVRMAYQRLPVQYPSDQVVQNIMRQASGRTESSRKTLFGNLFSFNPKWAMSVAALCLVVAFGLEFSHLLKSPRSVALLNPEYSLSGQQNGRFGFQMPDNFPIRSVALGDQEAVQDPHQALGDIPMNVEEEFNSRKKALSEADADALLMRGRRFKAQGRMDLALRDFETISRFYPDYSFMADVLLYQAQCYAFLGKTQEAVATLEGLIQRDPSRKALVESMISQIRESGASGEAPSLP